MVSSHPWAALLGARGSIRTADVFQASRSALGTAKSWSEIAILRSINSSYSTGLHETCPAGFGQYRSVPTKGVNVLNWSISAVEGEGSCVRNAVGEDDFKRAR